MAINQEKSPQVEIVGALSATEADRVGAFAEDALSESDARDSMNDPVLMPSEALKIAPAHA
jgi:hypothetical protein